jgi:hypothetical protein
MSLLDLLDSFSDFVTDAAYKDVKLIQQYYDDKRVINITGRRGVIVYDPEKIRDVEWDISIVESTATPAYRQIANDFLMQIWSAGQITLQQLLEHGDFPFGDDLLQSIQAQQEQMQEEQQAQAAAMQTQGGQAPSPQSGEDVPVALARPDVVEQARV